MLDTHCRIGLNGLNERLGVYYYYFGSHPPIFCMHLRVLLTGATSASKLDVSIEASVPTLPDCGEFTRMGIDPRFPDAGLPHDRTVSKSIGRRSSILGFDADMFALPAHGLAQQNASKWSCMVG